MELTSVYFFVALAHISIFNRRIYYYIKRRCNKYLCYLYWRLITDFNHRLFLSTSALHIMYHIIIYLYHYNRIDDNEIYMPSSIIVLYVLYYVLLHNILKPVRKIVFFYLGNKYIRRLTFDIMMLWRYMRFKNLYYNFF